MIENPLVTVNILSFNRKDELRNTLTKVYEQDYKNIEIIVVDNASSDGSADMVSSEFPEVILIKLEKNIGIAGWNKGFEIAKGEYVLVLDDDSYPTFHAISIAINSIINDNSIGVLALAINNPVWNKFENPEYETIPLLTFTGCGALVSRKVLEKVGHFEELLFIYLHELEYSMRVVNNNFTIAFEKKSEIIHNYSDINRGKLHNYRYDSRKDYYFFRNRIIVYLLHFSFNTKTLLLFYNLLKQLIKSLFNKTFSIKLKAIASVIFSINLIIQKRNKLSRYVQYLYINNHF